jgi:hypothetical protein
MRTSTNEKSGSGKKSLPVKWRDQAWLPRIVIRSSSRPLAAGASWADPPPARAARFSKLGFNRRAGKRLPRPSQPKPVMPTACLLRSRFSYFSRPDNFHQS